MLLIDSHAHLDFENFKDDLPEALQRAEEAEVGYIVNIATDRDSILSTIGLAEKYPQVYAVVGIHPHEADRCGEEDIELVRKYVSHPKVVAVGETGLDFYRKYADHDRQRELFRRMIAIAREAGKPLVIHNRAASEETLRILQEESAGEIGGVFHCYAGDAEFAVKLIRAGFYVSYAGNLTYPNSQLAEAAENIPLERTLVETDCPFLTPQPHRGERCEPAYVRFTAQRLAEIKELTLEDIARITSFNVHRLFGVGPPPKSAIAYPIRDSLYLNITNRCSCDCVFCPRLKNPVVKGHYLKLEREPEFEGVAAAVEKVPGEFRELVFCGFGEPTIRFELVKRLANHFRGRFLRLRLDTNGHGSLINGRDITSEIAEIFDIVSISLNTSDAQQYLKLNRPEFGEGAFSGMLEFLKGCRRAGLEVIGTVVGYPGADIEGTKQMAEELGIKFRVRKYDELG